MAQVSAQREDLTATRMGFGEKIDRDGMDGRVLPPPGFCLMPMQLRFVEVKMDNIIRLDILSRVRVIVAQRWILLT